MTETVISSATKEVVIGFDRPFVVIGERINPTGRKLLAAEMRAGDFSRVEADALAQVAEAVDREGFAVGVGRHVEPGRGVEITINGEVRRVARYEHTVILIGYDDNRDVVTLQDGAYKLYINGQLQASGKGVTLDPDNNGIGLGGINGITRSTASSDTRSAISRSVLSGRCGPCCSTAPSGWTKTLRSVTSRARSGARSSAR